ncbi:electron transport complex subunit RsxG [Psychromonas sp. MME2]|uniref:electron transport complex subunit RsxG n=1 Tax=unclassified Psychromonas TaxID=2614957 RepID=UPI00339CB26D
MIPTITRNGFLLAAFAIVCTACVAIVNAFTTPIIAVQEQKALIKIINQIIPESSYNNDVFSTCFNVSDDLLGAGEQQQVFIAKKNNVPVAAILETTTFRGYSGEIKLVLGVYTNGKVAGVRVIRHSETPGLGDKIQTNKSKWIYSFDDTIYTPSDDKQWEVSKNGGNFDAFTGASITPRAVVLAVKDALIYFDKNKVNLLNQPANCGA